jgi:hypothetical protein
MNLLWAYVGLHSSEHLRRSSSIDICICLIVAMILKLQEKEYTESMTS